MNLISILAKFIHATRENYQQCFQCKNKQSCQFFDRWHMLLDRHFAFTYTYWKHRNILCKQYFSAQSFKNDTHVLLLLLPGVASTFFFVFGRYTDMH